MSSTDEQQVSVLDDGRQARKSRAIVGIAAALVLVAGVAFAVTRGRSDPQSADSAATDSPLRLVLDDPPHGLVLASVSDRAPGVFGDTYEARLKSRSAPIATVSIQAQWSSSELPAGDSATVHGVPAVFTGYHERTLSWAENGVAFRIESFFGEKTAQRAFAHGHADRVQPGRSADPTAPPSFTLTSVPDGFDLAVPEASYEMAFRPDGDDAPSGTLEVTVMVGAPSATDYALMYGLEAVTVRGGAGYIRSSGANGAATELTFDLRENVRVILKGYFLTRTELLQAAAGLSVVSEGAWVKAMGHLLDPAPTPTTAATGSVPTSSTG
jgi:hypothetical protein